MFLRDTSWIILLALHQSASAETITCKITNPGPAYTNRLIQIDAKLTPGYDAGKLLVKENGVEVPYQLDLKAGSFKQVALADLWVRATLAAGATHHYEFTANAAPKKFRSAVTINREGNDLLIDNTLLAVKVPARDTGLTGPILSIRLPDDRWVAKSDWQTSLVLNSAHPRVTADGQLFAKVEIDYFFNDPRYGGPAVPFTSITLQINGDDPRIYLTESHVMQSAEHWALILGHAWKPAIAGAMKLSPMNEPQWLTAHDGNSFIAATATSSPAWEDPEANVITSQRPQTQPPRLICPIVKGSRSWMLVVGRANEMETLLKQTREP